ncbi:MAG: hypothetical protein HQ521_00330 [Bacteroidetes bacterium]|nr:hypothetical protein [Bacteroidota bacterium]
MVQSYGCFGCHPANYKDVGSVKECLLSIGLQGRFRTLSYPADLLRITRDTGLNEEEVIEHLDQINLSQIPLVEIIRDGDYLCKHVRVPYVEIGIATFKDDPSTLRAPSSPRIGFSEVGRDVYKALLDSFITRDERIRRF